MKRQVVLDTETTGLRPEDGHRIIEIGAVELIDGKRTGKTYYALINPERIIPEEAIKVHNIDNTKVKGAPLFKDVVNDFLAFIDGSELLIHNADFDIKFLNSELDRLNKGKIWDYVSNAVCTLKLSKRLYAGERSHKLDSICQRFGIDLSQREAEGHGALLDSQLLADVYIRINSEYSQEDIEADLEQTNWVRPAIKRYGVKLAKIELSPKEEELHGLYLKIMEEKDKVSPLFLKQGLKKQQP